MNKWWKSIYSLRKGTDQPILSFKFWNRQFKMVIYRWIKYCLLKLGFCKVFDELFRAKHEGLTFSLREIWASLLILENVISNSFILSTMLNSYKWKLLMMVCGFLLIFSYLVLHGYIRMKCALPISHCFHITGWIILVSSAVYVTFVLLFYILLWNDLRCQLDNGLTLLFPYKWYRVYHYCWSRGIENFSLVGFISSYNFKVIMDLWVC